MLRKEREAKEAKRDEAFTVQIFKLKKTVMMNEMITNFAPITLGEMKSIKLMNRLDKKFVTTYPTLLRLLEMTKDEYMMQVVDGERNMHYDTVYFDTNGYDMFYTHQAGWMNRQKLRFRTYVSSSLQFMEIKTKNNRGRTKKKRIEVKDINITDPERIEFINQHLRYPVGTLRPVIRNHFQRLTLVNQAKTERLTIDTNLQFHSLLTGKRTTLDDIVIIELKRDSLSHSPVLKMLNELRIFPHGFSKYCIGMSLTDDNLRLNRMKPKLTYIKKLSEKI